MIFFCNRPQFFFLGSLQYRTIFLSEAHNGWNMNVIYQSLVAVGAMMVAFSGCSIVVFEDGPVCPAASCSAFPLQTDTNPEMTLGSGLSPQAHPLESSKVELMASVSTFADVPPKVDGHTGLFSYDSVELSKKFQSELNTIAAFLVKEQNIKLIVEGHCDERGSRDYNLALGDRRAVVVRNYLASNGVDLGRIKTVSFGKERPVVVGVGPKVWGRNRRAVIRLVPQ